MATNDDLHPEAEPFGKGWRILAVAVVAIQGPAFNSPP